MLPRENFKFKSSEMAINASKTAISNINLWLFHRHIKQQVTTWPPHVRPKFKWINFQNKLWSLTQRTQRLRSFNVTRTFLGRILWRCQSYLSYKLQTTSYKLIGNSYKTKFVCSLFVGVQYCQITKPYLCGKWQIWVTKVKKKKDFIIRKIEGGAAWLLKLPSLRGTWTRSRKRSPDVGATGS